MTLIPINIKGQKFGRLTVIRKVESSFRKSPNTNKSIKHRALWLCKCDCEKMITVVGKYLRNGSTKSCGCFRKEELSKLATQRFTKHGNAGRTITSLYRSWQAMKNRCHNPNASDFRYYGGKGISVCNEWRNDFSVFQKWALQHGWKHGLTIERLDVKGNYEPSNCTWIPKQDQPKNQRYNRKVV